MQDQLQQLLQQQLQDVHLPQAIGWWPLAPGWWILAALLLLALLVLAVYLRRRWRRNRYRKIARLALQERFEQWEIDQNTGNYLYAANAILKRTLKHTDSASSNAYKTGNDWVTIIQQHAKKPLEEKSQQALAGEHYRPQPRADIDNLHPQLINWIKTHRHQARAPQPQPAASQPAAKQDKEHYA